MGDHTPRQRAWIALSELFRDTELDSRDHAQIAQTLRDAGFTAAASEKILREEVAPVFGWNLLSPAGNWTGWREEDVIQKIQSWLDNRAHPRRTGPATWLRNRIFLKPILTQWQEIAAQMDHAD